jgi:dTDP-4-amino-4,6-dideoxygalactose transaminase
MSASAAASSTSAAATFVPFHRAFVGKEEIDAVTSVLQDGWLTSGPRVKEFESAFARYTGATHAVALNSCTAALHLALAAVGVGEGDEVIVPTMTFAACGEVVLYLKARPVLVDCLNDSCQVDPEQIERAIASRTRAILPVHFGGSPCDMDVILDIASRYRLKVVDDAAHALPASFHGKRVGTLGDITCFSFYATKTITTGEGGMATTGNQEYADRMRVLSLHGISKNAWNRYTAQGTWRYDILEAGYKYNLSDLQAALGIAQLAKCDWMRERRAEIASIYTQGLASIDAFEPPRPALADIQHAWHLYVVRVKPEALRIDRDRVIEELKQKGIGTSVHFIPLHLHSLYRQQLGYKDQKFPNAERHFANAISLPIYPGLTNDDAARVIEGINQIALDFRR